MSRALELPLAALLLALALPVLAVALFAVRLEGGGPLLFRQVRVGRDERPFVCLKVRTMRAGTPQVATHLVAADAVTRTGRLLRCTRFDELPQLLNVLRGEMSLVGPRPCLPGQTELVLERRRRGVFALRPGITGLAQARGIDMSDPVRCAAADEDYLSRRSLGLDLLILLWTLPGLGPRR